MLKRYNALSTRTSFFISKLAGLNSKLNFSSCGFIADDSHVKIIWLHVVVFSKHGILHF